MARKRQSQGRVDLIATIRTQGAARGATAHPFEADVGMWLALGWQRVAEPVATTDDD